MASPARMPRPLFRPGGHRAPAARPTAAARGQERVRDRHDPKLIRYGCFLPDLTGLATAPPTPAPRGGYIRSPAVSDKGQCGPLQGLENTTRSGTGRAEPLVGFARPASRA